MREGQARHQADAYRLAVKEWDRTASESDRIDLKGYPESPTCTYQGKELAQVDEDGGIALHVGYLSEEQATALMGFIVTVYAPAAKDCHAIGGA